MRGLFNTWTQQKRAYAESNTNTVVITLNAIASEQHVLDYILWSIEETPVPGDAHLVVEDNTAGGTLLKVDLVAEGKDAIDFGGHSLECNASAKIKITLTCNTASDTNHLTVLYR